MPRSWIIALFVALAAIAWVGSGLIEKDRVDASSTSLEDVQASATGQPIAADRAMPEEQVPARPVRVVASEEQPVVNSLTLQGQTMADRTVEVRAKVDGQIEDLLVRRGDTVSAGDVIARLEVADREARVAEAQALLAQREVEFSAAERLNRQGYRSDTELAAAEAQLHAAQAAFRLARLNLDRTEIRAPFDGVVERLLAEEGDYVRDGDSIVELVDLDPLKIEIQVSERYLGQIEVGKHATARLLDGREMEGVVSFVGRRASTVTRTFTVEIELDNDDGAVIAGITATVHLPLAELRGHMLPASILTLDDDGVLGVMTVDEQDRARFREVHLLGETLNGAGVWLGNLPASVRVIVVGQGFVIDGTPVEPTEIPLGQLQNLSRSGTL